MEYDGTEYTPEHHVAGRGSHSSIEASATACLISVAAETVDYLVTLKGGLALDRRGQGLLDRLGEAIQAAKRQSPNTSIERLGRQEGRLQTLREDILEVLEARFSAVPCAFRERVGALSDETALKQLHRQAVLTPSRDAFQRTLLGLNVG
jgi:hypothetical protein